MRLKKHYSAREVAALTGLTARQLQWWDAHRLLRAAVASKRTAAGGYTERRYTPTDLLELMVLADLRRHGFSVARLRQLLTALHRRFGVRLYDAIGSDGPVTLLTNGHDIYARTARGEFYNLLQNPDQPLLVVGEESSFKELSAKARAARRKKTRPTKPRP
jgi:DNA-binding transcriptional MerR regulator